MHVRIKQEQTRILYAHRLNVLAGSFAIGVISTIVLWQGSDKRLLVAWFLCTLLLLLIRWRLTGCYQRTSRREQDDRYQYYAMQFSAGSFVNSLLWGIVPYVFYPDNPELFALILVMHAGYISGAALATSIHMPTLLAFTVPSSLLFLVGTLARGGWDHWPHAFLIALYAITILFYARRNNRSVMEQVSVRLENADLLVDLREQRDRAEKAMMDKNRFLAAASHDLRQPVHALGLFVSSLETKDDPVQRQYILSKIKQSTGALGSLFHGLLDISKLDANVLQNNPEDTPLDELMQLVEAEFQYTALEKGLELRIPTATGLIAYVDGSLLERILRNLVSNAVKFTNEGHVTVVVQPTGTDDITIAVEDTGSGIDESEFENIFSEYHQLKSPDRDRQQGLGLGLAIVHRLCELMEITITVESERHSGSTFSVIVPKGSVQVIKQTTAEVRSFEHQSLTVIVIDDEQDIIDGMKEVLLNWNYRAITAMSINEAMAALDGEEAPDIIIADFTLTGSESGLDAIRMIRDEFNSEIPAILLTGDTAPERLQQAASAAVQLMFKPVEPDLLREAVDRLVVELS